MGRKRVDLTGQRFRTFTVAGAAAPGPDGKSRFRCRCDCGHEFALSVSNVRRQGSPCGCGRARGFSPERRQRMRLDLTGERFGRLVVVGWAAPDRQGRSRFTCACDCGREVTVRSNTLRTGDARSCGCASSRATLGDRVRRHGHTARGATTPEFQAWSGMKRRCGRVADRAFPSYGGRGITVCDRWRDSFENFLADMGPRPSPRHSLDRVDNDGHYEPGNCRWATRAEQAVNRRNNRRVTVGGVTLTASQWAARTGVPARTISSRLDRGCKAEWAVSHPPLPVRAGTGRRSYLYRAWLGLRDRCHNPRNRKWPAYGGRGIVVCQRWDAFQAFAEDVGERPGPHHSLDRIDPDGPYSPENCRWATRAEQANNTRNNVRVAHDGLTLTLAQWADRLGLPRDLLYGRHRRGKRGDALFAPKAVPATRTT